MKQIDIAGKEYPLSYGFDFIRQMDERYHADNNGFTFGTGVQTAVMQLSLGNPLILEDIILSATHTLKSVPSKKNIEAWVVEQAEADKLQEVFDDFLASLKTAPLLKAQVLPILKAMEEKKA
ncbi:tail assembly chaperone [Streptococcus hyointestinalis]|uniref:tail assembly chaperone n=1 Tax=Streptococcus hyointestinalis TaxID=1337 RepID=UPI00351397A9